MKAVVTLFGDLFRKFFVCTFGLFLIVVAQRVFAAFSRESQQWPVGKWAAGAEEVVLVNVVTHAQVAAGFFIFRV